MNNQFHKKGAEAELFESVFDGQKALVKKRIPKNYRNKLLDESIRKKRTRAEAKLLKEAQNSVRVPRIFEVNENECQIIMEFIEGPALKEVILKKKKLCRTAGEKIKKLHDAGIIHGDLTTSNILVSEKDELVFVDFGLGFFSKKLEDKATDLVVFKKTFNATHSSIKDGWKMVLQGYLPSEEMKAQMDKIEKRARYH
jgi:Kae1-associated kinase Bud32